MPEPSTVSLSGKPSETVLPDPPAAAARALRVALAAPAVGRKEAVARVVAGWPGLLEGWAELGDLSQGDVEAYAFYRVGYHRGLDALRAAGWRGSGLVRWEHPPNRGFLRSLAGLRRVAGQIGETSEEDRCRVFLEQLDPGFGRSHR